LWIGDAAEIRAKLGTQAKDRSPGWGTGSIRAKIYSKRICPSLSPMFSVRLDVERQSSKGGITAHGLCN